MTGQFAVWVVAPSVQYTLTSFEVFFKSSFIQPGWPSVRISVPVFPASPVFPSSLVLTPSKFDVTFGFAVSFFYEARITG